MKKLFLLPLFIAGAMTFAHAQVQTSGSGAPSTSGMSRDNGPVMSFSELEHNFGTIKQGEVVTYEFRFKNSGKEPLIINNATGSCGCTVPDWPKEPIRPGGEGVIKVTFNSSGKMGMQDKTVTITYDTDKTIVLHMKGTVEAPNNTNPTGSGTASPAATTSGTGTSTQTSTTTTKDGSSSSTSGSSSTTKGAKDTKPKTAGKKPTTPATSTAKPAETTKPAGTSTSGGNH